jgi:preprotein translocase subunit SecD
VRKSLIAAGVGILLLLVFMIVYYRLPGVVACLSLLIYGAMLLAIFNAFSSQLSLTLTGIAAFFHSHGMAVDANVLIFERMKEELRAGRSLQASVESASREQVGHPGSNITTLIACLILFWLGRHVWRVHGARIRTDVGPRCRGQHSQPSSSAERSFALSYPEE